MTSPTSAAATRPAAGTRRRVSAGNKVVEVASGMDCFRGGGARHGASLLPFVPALEKRGLRMRRVPEERAAWRRSAVPVLNGRRQGVDRECEARAEQQRDAKEQRQERKARLSFRFDRDGWTIGHDHVGNTSAIELVRNARLLLLLRVEQEVGLGGAELAREVLLFRVTDLQPLGLRAVLTDGA